MRASTDCNRLMLRRQMPRRDFRPALTQSNPNQRAPPSDLKRSKRSKFTLPSRSPSPVVLPEQAESPEPRAPRHYMIEECVTTDRIGCPKLVPGKPPSKDMLLRMATTRPNYRQPIRNEVWTALKTPRPSTNHKSEASSPMSPALAGPIEW